jgi:hypothetical protein
VAPLSVSEVALSVAAPLAVLQSVSAALPLAVSRPASVMLPALPETSSALWGILAALP